jgi:hypothetical protein
MITTEAAVENEMVINDNIQFIIGKHNATP